jgi:Protein of unknown function (DUF1524)
MYDQLTQERVRILLAAIDARLQSDKLKGEQASFDYDKLQIEHIMPQSWQAHWPIDLVDAAERELAEQRRRSFIGCIGNLTLITGHLNVDVSNGAWSKKREGLQEHSQLVLNAFVVDCTEWDEQHIENRGRELAQVACRVWRGPGAESDRGLAPE